MPSDYCDLAQVRAYRNFDATDTDDDALLVEFIRRASRQIERYTQRRFDARTETHKFDYDGSSWKLFFGDDLLSCTSLTVSSTVIDATSYVLKPSNSDVHGWLEIKTDTGDYLTYTDTPLEAIEVAGVWGWHDDYANAWESSGATASALTANATSVTVSSGTPFAKRQTIQIDDEQMMVTNVVTTTLTVQRGINGTTAATHDAAAAIDIWRAPYDIQQACIRLVHWYYYQRQAAFEKTLTPELGQVTVPGKLPPDIEATLKPYRRVKL
jgi:hypothetical protein